MKAYFCAFINWEQNNWVQLLLMTEFAYNNFKNTNMDHTPFELNCGYHLCISFEDKYNTYSRSSSAKRLAMQLKKLMNVHC